MMEVMIVVAILAVMAVLVFVNVIPFMKSLYQKEMDETAQEIYVAAQNHLTIAESMGFLEGKEKGTKIKDDEYFFVIGKDNIGKDNYSDLADSDKVLAYMLPYGSIDEKVRTGGSYVISYDYKTASVIDVFYADPKGRFGDNAYFGSNVTNGYSAFLSTFGGTEQAKHDNRQKYSASGTEANGTAIIGWYNGKAMGVDVGEPFKVNLKVKNEDRLMVEATVSGADATATLEVGIIITGRTSGNHTPLLKLTYDSPSAGGKVYTGCLDDVASTYDGDPNNRLAPNNGHFAERFAAYGLIPGEDVTISAFAYYTKVVTDSTDADTLYPVAKGKKATTNSLFASIGKEKDDPDDNAMYSVARIAYTRHLENLSEAISGYDRGSLNSAAKGEPYEPSGTGTPSTMTTASEMASASSANSTTNQTGSSTADFAPTHARQIKDIDFSDFMDAVRVGNEPVNIHAVAGATNGSGDDTASGDGAISEDNTFMPVTTDYVLDYNGSNHKISNVVVNTAGDAGLFSTLPKESSLENMRLMSFDIESTDGNAGALAGTLENVTVKNVLVFNEAYEGDNTDRKDKFGPDFGESDTTDAKLEITGAGSVGGLVGSMDGGSVEKSAASVYVRTSGTSAGGLIGEASGTEVTSCYAGGHYVGGDIATDNAGAPITTGATETGATAGRMNVVAANAGGLIGDASSTKVTGCYATNSVYGTASAGGLAGSATGGSVANSYAAGKVAGAAGGVLGAFIGSNGAALGAGNQYTPTVNGSLPSIGSNPADATVADMFPDLTSYRAYITAEREAEPYDSVLAVAYTIDDTCLYPMKVLADLTGYAIANVDPDFVTTHYGDWPKLETEVVNR